MTFAEVFSTLLSSPSRVYSNIKERILPTGGRRKRHRDDGNECIELQQEPSRLRFSGQPAKAAGPLCERGNGAGPAKRANIGEPGRARRQHHTLQPPAPFSSSRAQAAYETGRFGAGRAPQTGPTPVSAAGSGLVLYGSLTHRRHGPTSGFASSAQRATPHLPASLGPQGAAVVREEALEGLRRASAMEVDAEAQRKAAAAQRAAMVHKLVQAEQAHTAGQAGPSRLDGGAATLRRRLDMGGSAQQPLQDEQQQQQQQGTWGSPSGRRPHPWGHAKASGPAPPPPPSWAQQQAMAALQLHREQDQEEQAARDREQAKRRAAELAARQAFLERKKLELTARAEAAMGVPAAQLSASARSMVIANANALKLLEEEQRRMEALRGSEAALARAVGTPLPDGEPGPAPPRARGAPAAKHAGRHPLRPVRNHVAAASPAAAAAKARPRQPPRQPQEEAHGENGGLQEEGGAVVLLSSDDEEEEQSGREAGDEADVQPAWEDGEEEQGGEEEAEEETSLSEALEGVRVRDEDDEDDEIASARRLPRLTKAQLALVERALGPGDPAEILVHHKGSNIEMTRRLMACLQGTAWLNDEVINIYAGLLQDRDAERRKDGLGPRCHFFNSFFLNKLYKDAREYNYQSVRRWTLEKKLRSQNQASKTVLDVDLLLVPVHLGNHWTCACVDLQRRELRYYDSFQGKEAWVMEALRRYVADEARNKLDQELDTSHWPIEYVCEVPIQHNGCDCGVFALQFADHLSRGAALDFHQRDMQYFRAKMAADIMSLRIS